MNRKCFKALAEGDTVREQAKTYSFTVMGNYGNQVIAVRTWEMSNPIEWSLETGVIEKISDIKVGDKVSHKHWPIGTYAIVTGIAPKFAIVTMTVLVTSKNMKSWNLIFKASHKRTP